MPGANTLPRFLAISNENKKIVDDIDTWFHHSHVMQLVDQIYLK
jgi:hypothetical protein